MAYGDHEQCQAVHDRRGEDEDLRRPFGRKALRPMREAATMTADWAVAEEYLLRYIGLGGTDVVSR